MNIEANVRVPRLTGILARGSNGGIIFSHLYLGKQSADEYFSGDFFHCFCTGQVQGKECKGMMLQRMRNTVLTFIHLQVSMVLAAPKQVTFQP